MNLLKRVLVAVVAIPIRLFLFYKGGYYLLGFLSLLSFLMGMELIGIFNKKDIVLPVWFALFLPLFTWMFSVGSYDYAFLTLFFVAVFSSAKDIFSNKLDFSLNRLSVAVFMLFYASFLLSFLYKISQFSTIYVILLIVLIWVCDTGAYFVGMTLGRHRGYISASPKKSVEGFIGGFLFSVIFGFLFSKFFSGINLKTAVFAAIASGIFGQFGDLAESMIKRDVKIKDSSNLIPGHGGILDRFDSLLFAAPAFYFLLKLF